MMFSCLIEKTMPGFPGLGERLFVWGNDFRVYDSKDRNNVLRQTR